MKDLADRVVRACRSLTGAAGAGTEIEAASRRGEQLAKQGAVPGTDASESLVSSVHLQFSPVVALFVRSQTRTITWPLPSGQPIALGDLLRQVEQQAPESLMEPGTCELRPHIRVSINGRAGVKPEHQVNAGDVVWIGMRLLEGG